MNDASAVSMLMRAVMPDGQIPARAGQGPAAQSAIRAGGIDIALPGQGGLASVFPVTDLAVASIGAAAHALAQLMADRFGAAPAVEVDRRLASFWFAATLRPDGWELPAARDIITGDYATRDGWIRLHANVPTHREAALRVLGADADPESVARAVSGRDAVELEEAVVHAGGAAAAMRTQSEWAAHPQGRAVGMEPVFDRRDASPDDAPSGFSGTPERPLAGLRVLDLTRVLAGPVSTRFLAAYGAQVLRIDPPFWSEPGVVPEVTLGKRCARLDLRIAEQRQQLRRLMSRADVLVHGYRPDVLDRLDLGAEARQALRPGLVDVCLDAYGWTGPWSGRRGFDSLVQMSSGIAHAGMLHAGGDRPVPLPVQALDHATGYLIAAAAIRGLAARLREGRGSLTRLSLARTAALLATPLPAQVQPALAPRTGDDYSAEPEVTPWGPAHRLKPPCRIQGAPMRWDYPAGPLGASAPCWTS